MVTCCGEEALVWGDAEAVDLRVGVGNGTGADAAQGFPESVKQYCQLQALLVNRLEACWLSSVLHALLLRIEVGLRVAAYRIVWS